MRCRELDPDAIGTRDTHDLAADTVQLSNGQGVGLDLGPHREVLHALLDDDLQVCRPQCLLAVRKLHPDALGSLRTQHAALRAVEHGGGQGVRLNQGPGGKVASEGNGLLQQRLDLLLPPVPIHDRDVVVPGSGPALEFLVGSSASLVAVCRLCIRDDLVLIAVHDQRWARHRRELPKCVEWLLQHLEHPWLLCEQHGPHHLHHRQPLDGHEARVNDQTMDLAAELRSQMHRARRPDGTTVHHLPGAAAAGGVEQGVTLHEAKLGVAAELREARSAGAPAVTSVVDGQQRRSLAMEHICHVVHGCAHLRISMEEVHHCLERCRVGRDIEPVAHLVAAGDVKSAIPDGPRGRAEVCRLDLAWVERNVADHRVVPDAIQTPAATH
mmetsp:Transcript_39895/g.127866  ORF Transcript_39895/g.127866 Transcript_39895/m.127866 type:complete len:383 (+) Transcript_39895:136-1284(+)